MPIRRFIYAVFSCFFLIHATELRAQTDVQVFGYPFPPFVTNEEVGVTQDFLKRLNAVQSEFRFSFQLTSPKRRYRLFKQQKGDLILFEMPEWGWTESGAKYQTTRQILTGGEVFIAVAAPDRGQEFFKNIAEKRIAAYSGYHYQFARFNADQEWLKENFDITLTDDHETNIRVLLADHVDLSIITQSFLNQYLHSHPHNRKKLLVSAKRDQDYRLAAVVRDGGPISAQQFEAILSKLDKTGDLERFFAERGLAGLLTYKAR